MIKTRHDLAPIFIWGTGDLYFILSVLVAVMFGILSPDLQKQLHLSSAQLGLLASVSFISYGVAQFFAGSLLDLLGPRLVIGSSGIIASAGLFLLSISKGLELAISAQLLIGIGFSTSYIGAIYLANMWFPPERFSLISGITQMSANIVSALVLLGMALSKTIPSFRLISNVLGFVALALAILMFLLIRSAPKKEASVLRPSFWHALVTIFRIPQFWLATAYFSAGFGVLLAFSDLWNILDQLAYGHSLQTAASMNAMLPLGGALGATLAGLLADYLERRSSVAVFYMLGMFVIGAILVYSPVLPLLAAILLLVLFGFFLGGAVLAFPLVSQQIPPSLIGIGFGLMSAIAYLISAFLQYLIGVLEKGAAALHSLDAIGKLKLGLTPLIITLVIGMIFSWWLKDPIKNRG